MFDLTPLMIGTTARSGPSQWLAEAVATFSLVLAILGGIRYAPHGAIGANKCAVVFEVDQRPSVEAIYATSNRLNVTRSVELRDIAIQWESESN